MSCAADYVYDAEQQMPLPEFHKKYKDKLPMLVIVTEGFYGETKYDDFSNDQVVRFHRPCEQLRALGRLSRDADRLRDEFLSIPVDSQYKFSVVKSSKQVGDAQTMDEIIKENKLPVQVRYASYNIQLRATLDGIKGLNILIMKTYIEHFIQGNCIEDGILSPVPTVAALSPEISVAIITGYTEKSQEDFKNKLRSMDLFVEKNVKFKEHDGSCDLTIFERGAETTGTGNAIPPDLLPRDYTHGGDYHLPPPKLMPRASKKKRDTDGDGIYDKIEDSETRKTQVQQIPQQTYTERPLPPRPYEKLKSDDGSDQTYQEIEADETSELPSASGGEYMYIGDVTCAESGYNSSNSWSAGSSRSHVSDKSVQDIQDILKVLNLSKFCKAFKEQLIDGAVLEDLNEEVLRKDFGFMHVEAVRLMKYVRAGHVPK